MMLSELAVGGEGTVIRVDAAPPTKSFLTREGLVPGAGVKLLAVGRDGDCLIQLDATEVHLGGQVTGNVMVSVP
jgi:Fe2+ transport system protein FeoA